MELEMTRERDHKVLRDRILATYSIPTTVIH